MAFCSRCGAEAAKNNKFCTACGAALTQPQPEPETVEQNINTEQQTPNKMFTAETTNMGYDYQPYETPNTTPPPFSSFEPIPVPKKKADVSVGMFIGIFLLFSIPLAGLIVAIAWACRATKNETLVNYARAWLIMMGVSFVIALILGIAISAIIAANLNNILAALAEAEEFFKNFNGLNIYIN